ncbi:MAG: hypothetical protein V1802_01625 [Candidatus Aenigmatarchaeota archaeon]
MVTIKNYFDAEIKVTLLSTITGIIAGYISFLANKTNIAIIVAIVLVFITAFIAKKIFKITQDKKWWIYNCGIIFLLIWLIVWTIFYNLAMA